MLKNNVFSFIKNINSKEFQEVKISLLKTDPEFKAVFEQEPDKVQRIAENIKKNGYDKSQPIIVLPDMTIIDGYSRYLAAQKTGIALVPVVIKEFKTREDALLYMYHLQLDRRNLTDMEVFTAFKKLENLKNTAKKDGQSIKEFTDQKLAEKLKVSPRQLSKMREIQKKAPAEIQEQIEHGTCTINRAHVLIKKQTSTKVRQPHTNIDKKLFLHGVRYVFLEISKGRNLREIYEQANKKESMNHIFTEDENKEIENFLTANTSL